MDETRRFWLAAGAATTILTAGGFVWYRVLLRDFYQSQTPRRLRRSLPLLPVNLIARAVSGIWLTRGFPRGYTEGSNLREGFKYGVWAGALASIPSALSRFTNQKVGLPATVASMGIETLLGGLAGMAVSAIYGLPSAEMTYKPQPVHFEMPLETDNGYDRVWAPPQAEVVG